MNQSEPIGRFGTFAAALLCVAALQGCNNGGETETAARNSDASAGHDIEEARESAPAAAADPSAAQNGTATEVASFLGIRAPRPASWTEIQPQSAMHHASFSVPAPAGTDGDPAQIVVFFFGPGQGGPIEGNIVRWQGQFRSPEGNDVEPEVRTLEVNGMPVTLVELEGEYRGMGQWYTPNQRFITAVVDAPGDRRIFIRLVGDYDTVTANLDGFLAMIEGMEWVGP